MSLCSMLARKAPASSFPGTVFSPFFRQALTSILICAPKRVFSFYRPDGSRQGHADCSRGDHTRNPTGRNWSQVTMDILAQSWTQFHPWGHLLIPAPAVLPTKLYQWPHICQPLMGTGANRQESEVTHFGAPWTVLHTGLSGSLQCLFVCFCFDSVMAK